MLGNKRRKISPSVKSRLFLLSRTINSNCWVSGLMVMDITSLFLELSVKPQSINPNGPNLRISGNGSEPKATAILALPLVPARRAKVMAKSWVLENMKMVFGSLGVLTTKPKLPMERSDNSLTDLNISLVKKASTVLATKASS